VTGVVTLWRIATETRDYKADDLSGRGAAGSPGRWNIDGERIVYASTTLALAVLETAAHVRSSGLPLNRFVAQITVPPAVWNARQITHHTNLDPAWQAIPAGRASAEHGSAWYKSGSSVLLLVPSVIVPEEFAVLINASHPDARSITAATVRPFPYDRLFRRS
jgi:RES domain-containing protein